MSGRAITTPSEHARPLVSACQLKHHRPGERVVFSEWCEERRQSVKRIGRVESHLENGRRITVAVEPSGRHHLIECGAVAAASP